MWDPSLQLRESDAQRSEPHDYDCRGRFITRSIPWHRQIPHKDDCSWTQRKTINGSLRTAVLPTNQPVSSNSPYIHMNTHVRWAYRLCAHAIICTVEFSLIWTCMLFNLRAHATRSEHLLISSPDNYPPAGNAIASRKILPSPKELPPLKLLGRQRGSDSSSSSIISQTKSLAKLDFP